MGFPKRKYVNAVTETRQTYDAWKAMWRRCTDEDGPGWENYGGRGIRVSSRWGNYDFFVTDMGLCPEGKMLDRINNDGDYEPGNCRWTDRTTQNNNRRNVRDIEIAGAHHGTVGGYTNSGCRCEACKAAKRQSREKDVQ